MFDGRQWEEFQKFQDNLVHPYSYIYPQTQNQHRERELTKGESLAQKIDDIVPKKHFPENPYMNSIEYVGAGIEAHLNSLTYKGNLSFQIPQDCQESSSYAQVKNVQLVQERDPVVPKERKIN